MAREWKAATGFLGLEAKVKATKRDKDKAKLAGAYRALAASVKGTPMAKQMQARATQLEALD